MESFYFNPFALVSLSSFLIMTTLGLLLWFKFHSSQTRFIMWLFLANAIYSLFYSFEISVKTLSEITLFYRLEYFGISVLSSFYLMFALQFTGKNRWLTSRNIFLILLIPAITVLMVDTNHYHHLFYYREELDLTGPYPSFSFIPSVWYYIHQIYVIGAMLLSLGLLVRMFRNTAQLYRSQLRLILLATTFPFLGYLFYQLHLIPYGIDPVSFTFTITGIVVYLALSRFKLFDLVPIARSKLFEIIEEGVSVFDLSNRLVDYNQTANSMLGLTRKDIGKKYDVILRDWPELEEFFLENGKGKLEFNRLFEGKRFFYESQILELENNSKAKQGKLLIIRDISELTNVEQERNVTASKLDAIISSMPDMMFVIDKTGVLTDFFASDTDRLFLNKEEVLGASLYQLFNAEEAETLMKMLSNCLKTKHLTTYEYEMNFPGTMKYYEVRISRLDNFHVLVIVRDVTESKDMRQDLLYQSGFQKILMGLAARFINIPTSETSLVINDSLRQISEYIDVDRCYIYRYDFENGTMTNTHEWCRYGTIPLIDQRQNIPVTHISDWSSYHQRGEPAMVENLKKLKQNDPIRILLESIDIKSVITIPMISQDNCLGFVGFESTKDKRKWFDSEISLLNIFTGMMANLQEKINIEQSLIEARIKAEASNRLKTAFMNNISHEIRTPLNGIIGFGEIIANEHLSLEEKNQFLTVVQESSERLISTIDDYLDISMLVTGNQEVHNKIFRVSSLIEEVIEDFSAHGKEKGITVVEEIPPNLRKMHLHSDVDLIRKALNHLISNSLKFTNMGKIVVGFNRIDGYCKFYVSDTGIGIAEEAKKYVFDSFMQEDFSSTRMYEGSGLGLSIVKGIITLLGGEVTLQSVKGEGTTMNFTIPAEN
ncbi:MAG: histidine kinase N-terminal 7TM domain-containing protein [Prolixibacteraceae bacterium]